jgi:hypothetical protein
MNLKQIAKEIRDILSERQKEFFLTFEEDKHRYTMKDMDGVIRDDFPSVSKVMKLFYDEFPTEEAARNKAKGDPYVMQTLLAEWEEAGKISTNMGSRVHYELEIETIKRHEIVKEVRQPIYECDMEMIMKGDRMIKAGYKFLKLMEERGAVLLDTEIVLGHPVLGYTGQPDKVWLMFNRQKTGFGLVITDWKTNKKKNMETNDYTKPMKEPFKFLPNNALGHYNTQLPLYGKLLLKMLEGTKYEGIGFYGCVIVHLTEEQEFTEYRVERRVVDTILNMDIKSKLTTLKK